jgi:hypothetical protein
VTVLYESKEGYVPKQRRQDGIIDQQVDKENNYIQISRNTDTRSTMAELIHQRKASLLEERKVDGRVPLGENKNILNMQQNSRPFSYEQYKPSAKIERTN